MQEQRLMYQLSPRLTAPEEAEGQQDPRMNFAPAGGVMGCDGSTAAAEGAPPSVQMGR